MPDGEPLHGHWSHDIVEVEPRLTTTHQMPVQADHENHVHFNPSRSTAFITNHTTAGREGMKDALAVEFYPHGGNRLLNPPRLHLRSLSGEPVTVTVESLLYAIKQMQDEDAYRKGPQSGD